MKQPNSYSSFFSLALTLTDDNSTRITDFDIPFYDMNIHCMDNDLYYGDGSIMLTPMGVGDVAFFRNGNLKDIHIKNRNAGSNGTVYCSGTVPQKFVMQQLGLLYGD